MKNAATYHIPGLDCPDELALIEKGLRRVEGVGALVPDYLQRTLQVEFDPGKLDAVGIEAAIERIGFQADLADSGSTSSAGWSRRAMNRTTLLGGSLLAAAMISWACSAPARPVAVLAILSTLISGAPVARAAWRAVRLRSLDMNVLMTVAAVGAIATGEHFEAATAMFLFCISLWLESYSMGRARRAVQSLVELTPTVAHRQSADGTIEDVEPASLTPKDRVLVRPGERIPIDGDVVSGASSVNQAPITGESLPVEKSPGERVFAGTINGEGSLEVRVTRTADETTLAHVARLVTQAQATRSPTERFVDTFARRYTPAVIVLAIALAVVPPLLAQWGVGWAATAEPGQWFHRALVLLVIACPCALVISTPVTIVSGLYRAARRGMLVKGGEYLEAAGQIDAMALDKTGTLTTGKLQVVDIVAAEGATTDEVLRTAAALERHSEHPLAQAIVTAADERALEIPDAADFAALRGFGLQGIVEGTAYFVGSPRLMREQGLDGFPLSTQAEQTVVLLASQQRVLGGILLADQLRTGAADAIGELRRLGVTNVAVLTGDRREVAQLVADRIGADQVFAELLPEDKVSRVEELVREAPNLAMVGDGVNDAPAMAAAKLGIALGSQASDTALETADIVIISPQLTRLPELVQLGRRCRRLLGQNITLALAAKAVVLVLAAMGLATMWMAVAADVGASLLVITNGMRLLGQGKD